MRISDWSSDVCSSDLDAAPIVAYRINPTLQARRYRLPITLAWTLITTGIKQFMAKEELPEMQGSVTEVLPDSHFRVTLENGNPVLPSTGGKMRKHQLCILSSDKVTLELSPSDLTRGRLPLRPFPIHPSYTPTTPIT